MLNYEKQGWQRQILEEKMRGVVLVAADPSGLMYADVCNPLTVRTNMPKEPHPVVPRTNCRLSLASWYLRIKLVIFQHQSLSPEC